MAKQRLQRILATAGIALRRRCEELILQGTVKVNGQVVGKLPAFADLARDLITVADKKIEPEKKVYFLLNKPKGVICTSSDPQGRKKAIDIIPARQRIFCVGRLDADTIGLVILTNDSELANRLTHPRYKVPKTYVAQIKGQISSQAVEKLEGGIWLAEGKNSRAAVKISKRGREESWLQITIQQGLNPQIRRMLAKVGLSAKVLKRTRIGPVTIRGLGVGKFRALTEAEVTGLKRALSAKTTFAHKER
jgi:pseudouridine synthase